MAHYLIIAATSDIGTALAKRLYHQGHQLWLTGRQATTKILADMPRAKYSVLDATDFEAVEKTVAEVKAALGGLDGVVSCAGSLLLKPAHLTTWDEYLAVMQASLTTSFATVRAVGKHLYDTGGSTVLVASAAAIQGIANHEAIAAAKGGVISLARSAAATYATANLRFNVVAPGLTATKMTAALTENDFSRKASEALHALRRLGTVEDITSAIVTTQVACASYFSSGYAACCGR